MLGAVLCAVASLPANSAPWTRIAKAGSGLVTYYAEQRVQREGPLLRARLLYDYKEPQENPDGDHDHAHGHDGDFLSTTVVAYFDCKQRRIAVESMKNYEKNMGRGRLVGQSVATAAPRTLREVAAASVDDQVLAWACSRARR